MTVVMLPWVDLDLGSRIVGRDGKTYMLTRRHADWSGRPVADIALTTDPLTRWTIAIDPNTQVPVIATSEQLALATLRKVFRLERISQ